jgi:hypothetical protein
MMNVDDRLRVLHDEIRGQYLHVSRENHYIDLILVQKIHLLGFRV